MTQTTRLTLAAALASALASLAVCATFEQQDWLPIAWSVIAVIAGTGALLRWSGVPRWAVPVGQVLVLAEVFLLSLAGGAMAYVVVPTPAAVAEVAAKVGEGLLDIARYASPAPSEPGLVLVAVGGIAVMALLVDLLAVTLRLVPWAGLPLLAAYAVPSAVIRGGLSWFLFVPAAVGYVVLLVAEGQGRLARWGRPVSGTRTRRLVGSPTAVAGLTRSGRRLGAVVIVLAVLVPALLPALPESVLSSGSGDGTGPGGRTIRTDNPIVDLRRDLLAPPELEILRYRTDDTTPDYVKRVTLDVFDGRVWQASGRAVPDSQQVSGGMPEVPGLTSDTPRTEHRTEFAIGEDLDSRWLPLVYPATGVEIDGDWRYDVQTLDVVANDGSTLEQEYAATHVSVAPTPESLERASGELPDDVRDLTVISQQTSDVVAPAVREALATRPDAQDPYDQAVALQDWFRDPANFTYSTERRAGNSEAALEAFLEERLGYCEQFAATMALMARDLGIPARVAVGFLPGQQDADGEWVVMARDAHAWPELYFAGAGWVRFEPTPASRTGQAPAWAVPPTASPSAGPELPSSSAGASAPANPREREDVTGGAPVVEAAQPFPWGRVALFLALPVALAVTPLVAAFARRRRWRRADGAPPAEAEAAWTDLQESVRDAQQPWDPAATPRGAARDIGSSARLSTSAREALGRLATAVEHARYAPVAGGGEDVREDAAAVRTALLDTATGSTRWRARLFPAAGRDALGRLVQLGGSGLDEVESVAHRLRGRLSRRDGGGRD